MRLQVIETNLIHGDGFHFHYGGCDCIWTVTEMSILLHQTPDVDSMHVDVLAI